MRTTPTAAALHRFLEVLDAEDWEQLAGMLADDVELADELTAAWLRGRDTVAAYLRASTGVVTEIVSTASDVATRRLGGDTVLHTFQLRQRYRLDGQERRERLTGCAVFTHAMDNPKLALFQLGQAASSVVTEEAPAPAAASGSVSPVTLGSRLRRAREAAGLSLRALGDRSGLSASFLSQLERSQADVSVAALTRIARAVGVGVGELIGEGAAAAGGRSPLRLPELGLDIETLHAPAGARLEAAVIELEPEAPVYDPRDVDGERVIYVLEGTLALHGSRPSVLLAGEGAHLRGGAYRLAARGDRRVRFLSAQLVEEASA